MAQDAPVTANATKNTGNAAAPFDNTSAARANLFSATSDSDSSSFALATPSATASLATPAPAASPAAPAPKPRLVFGDRDDYRWQIGLGVEFFRFQSNRISASLVGLNTTLTYFTNDWFGLEGSLVTGFAPTVYSNEHVKYFGGSGGFRVGSRRARFEPWGHVLVGVGHLQPQLAGASRNALTLQAGLGLDYRVNSRLSLRAEGDYVYSKFFSDQQNNFQGVAGLVFHF
jgi:opacity protein-like surface antigen